MTLFLPGMLNGNVNQLLQGILKGDFRSLAKSLTLIENMMEGSETLLESLPFNKNIPVIGITGPPGAGKSSLADALVSYWTKEKDLKIGIIAVDPTSPFNFGALLGDRIRLSQHFMSEKVFIRSMASRGALGGLSNRIVEACDLMKNAGFDLIIIETIGVGQSEVEIAGLADTTVLVLVPEAGDEIQVMKSGIMEIGDIFVVNKSDRAGADSFSSNLKNMLHQKTNDAHRNPPVVKTSAIDGTGIEGLAEAIQLHQLESEKHSRKQLLLAKKAWNMISEKRMSDISIQKLEVDIQLKMTDSQFNLYKYIKEFI